MSYSTFNQNKFDFLTQPMFLGETPNVSRYDQQKHAKFEKDREATGVLLASGRS